MLPSQAAWDEECWLALRGGRKLALTTSWTALVPGQAIFGSPRPVLDKKGTAAGHFHPRGTHCSVRGLTYGLPAPRAQGGWVGAVLPGVTVSWVWGKSANGLCSAHTEHCRCSWGLGLLTDPRTGRDTRSHCSDSSLPADHPQLKRARESAPKGGRDA